MTCKLITRTPLLILLAALVIGFVAAGCAKHKDYNKGLVLMKKKKYTEAAAAFERAIKQYPNMGEAHYNLGACHYYLAVKAMDKGDKDNALKHVKLSVSAKLKARDLFRKGKYKVIRDKKLRERILSHLDHMAAEWKTVSGKDSDILMYLSGQKQPKPPPDALEPPPGAYPPAPPGQPAPPSTGQPPGSTPEQPRPSADTRPARPPAETRPARPAASTPSRPAAKTRPARPESR
jgi:tetratricopeptide (TPR) repeat protein